ncbi:FAD-dependent monooxygenase [Streptomyces lydicus]|uniref:FAD-dependent monooxygenase n=1 Tax=Streptomyces lydicus TaxID=47763 RepID=UPI00101321ED|nr:FAD-dependent monooxygenase [Streptomyces lydicus]MCZ1008564.1 FAD-dependent monooxygenase [Streptomyces lydicus]
MHAARDLTADTHASTSTDVDTGTGTGTGTGTDVIVVGAGPTGLLLGAELALAGVRVQILERRATAQRDSRALTLHPRSIELMDQRGLAERFLAAGRRVPGWHFAGLDTRLDFSALDTRHGYTLFLAQARTEQLLAERASELAVPVRRGYEVVGLRRSGKGGDAGGRGSRGGRESGETGVEVDLRGPGGTLETVRARYVVGCDGGRSVVRRAAGIGFPGTDETLSGALGDFATVDPAALDRARAHGVLAVPLEPEPPAGPGHEDERESGGATRIVLLDPQRMRTPSAEPLTLDEFRASLRRICGTDCGVARPRWLSRFGNATRLAASYRAGRVLLAGDAAHIHFPAAGQGLNTGLQDAMNLGWKLAAEINGWAPPGLLDSYHAERHPVGQAVTENTEVQTLLAELALLPPYQRPAAALRALLTELLDIEEVNRRLAGRISALDTAYLAAGTDADLLVGRRMPDIALTATGAESLRLYELLPHGRFVLLDLAGDQEIRQSVEARWGKRVTALSVTECESRTDLDGVREILVRPDGHIAWATRSTEVQTRRTERFRALTSWAGRPAGD